MATLSAWPTLLVSSRVLYHILDDPLHCPRLLEPLATETHFQPYHIAPTLQLFPLHPDLVDLGDLGPVPNDFGPQGMIAHASQGVADMCGCWEVRLQHSHCFIGERFNVLRSVVGCRV